MFSYGPPHMAKQVRGDQLEPTYSSSVRTRDVAQRTCPKRWTIGRRSERGSGISILATRYDDDDEMSNSSIWPIDGTLSGAITLGQSGPGSNGNKGVLHIPQSSSITRVSPSDCLVSCPGHSLGEFYPSAEMQSVNSVAPANLANTIISCVKYMLLTFR